MPEVRRYLTVLQDREGYPSATPLPTKEDAGEPPQLVSVVRESDYEALEQERDHWQRCAIDERGLASGEAYKEVKDHILDELDKQAGAGAALAVAVALCAASEARTRATEEQFDQAREALKELTRVCRQAYPERERSRVYPQVMQAVGAAEAVLASGVTEKGDGNGEG